MNLVNDGKAFRIVYTVKCFIVVYYKVLYSVFHRSNTHLHAGRLIKAFMCK